MKLHLQEKFAVVTGASQGLGKAFAIALANRGIHTILVALPNEELEQVVKEIQQKGVYCYSYETDLTDKKNIVELAQWINQRFNVFILINNAGFGGSKVFADADISYIQKMILLNVVASTLLIHQLLPNLIENQQSYILGISSMASFTPTAFKTVYPATKRFMQHFSQGLREELKPKNVSVSVAYPGPMNTNSAIAERIKRQGKLANFIVFTPKEVADVCIQKMLQRKSFILIGWSNKFTWVLLKILPTRFITYWLSRTVKRELKVNV